MNTSHKTHPLARRFSYFLAGLALLAAGYAGMQLTPTIHATSSGAQQGQQVLQCPSTTTHC